MFDIAFSELLVIALVALIVIGPEKLPGLARTAGNLWGRAQRYVNNIKNEIAKDAAIEEARKLQHSLQQDAAEIERKIQENGLTLEQHLLQSQYRKPAPNGNDSAPASSDPTQK